MSCLEAISYVPMVVQEVDTWCHLGTGERHKATCGATNVTVIALYVCRIYSLNDSIVVCSFKLTLSDKWRISRVACHYGFSVIIMEMISDYSTLDTACVL